MLRSEACPGCDVMGWTRIRLHGTERDLMGYVTYIHVHATMTPSWTPPAFLEGGGGGGPG